MVVVLKLGGSVITRKEAPETLDPASLEACARAVGGADGDLVLVHGAGSFGHHHAETHGVTVSEGTHDPVAVSGIHGSMRALNAHVVAALHEAGVAAVGVDPLSLAHRDAAGSLSLAAGAVSTMLAEGFVPVLFGDVVARAGHGFTVLSGDELAAALAGELGASRVGMCSSVPGVYDAEGEVVDRLGSLADVDDALGGSHGPDVTGGMAGKVRELLELSVPAAVFGLDDLPRFLAGEDVGTRVDGPAGGSTGADGDGG